MLVGLLMNIIDYGQRIETQFNVGKGGPYGWNIETHGCYQDFRWLIMYIIIVKYNNCTGLKVSIFGKPLSLLFLGTVDYTLLSMCQCTHTTLVALCVQL